MDVDTPGSIDSVRDPTAASNIAAQSLFECEQDRLSVGTNKAIRAARAILVSLRSDHHRGIPCPEASLKMSPEHLPAAPLRHYFGWNTRLTSIT